MNRALGNVVVYADFKAYQISSRSYDIGDMKSYKHGLIHKEIRCLLETDNGDVEVLAGCLFVYS